MEVDRTDGVRVYREIEYGACSRSVVVRRCSACRKLELAKMRVDRRLLGASNAGVVLHGDLWWRKLEERREEMKVLFGKRLEGMEDSQLVKLVVDKMDESQLVKMVVDKMDESQLVKMVEDKLREDGGIRWWEEYRVLR